MSTELPPTPDWQSAHAGECAVCGHSAPPTCELCGGLYGLPGIPRCQRCIGRGPTPTIEATEPRQLPPLDPLTAMALSARADPAVARIEDLEARVAALERFVYPD